MKNAKKKHYDDVYMEDIEALVNEFCCKISKEYEINPDKQPYFDEMFFPEVQAAVQRLFNYPNYRNYN